MVGGLRAPSNEQHLEIYEANICSTLRRRFPEFSWEILEDLKERGSHITKGEHLAQKVETSLYSLQQQGRVRRNPDGSYSLTSQS